MDAACGPSNGVKSLRSHFDQDRSLHQAHIRSGPINQHFREPLSSEQINRATQEQNTFLQASRVRQVPERYIGETFNSPWTSEFQETNNVRQQPIPQAVNHIRPQQSLGGWGAEFLAAQQQQQQQNHFHQFEQQQHPMQFNQPYTPLFQPTQSKSNFMQHISTQSNITSDDQELFNQAFAEAEASLQQVNLEQQQQQQQQQVRQEPEFSPAQTQLEEMQRLDPRAETLDDMKDRIDSDTLSSTAGALIESLKSENSEKFKNSNFMRLMHQLRDKEVLVRDEKMVDAQSGVEVKSHIAGGSMDTSMNAYPSHELQSDNL